MEVLFFPQKTTVEVLKIHYQYNVIDFFCSSRTGSWSSEKYVTGIQFVYSWINGRKEIIFKFENIFSVVVFSIL